MNEIEEEEEEEEDLDQKPRGWREREIERGRDIDRELLLFLCYI